MNKYSSGVWVKRGTSNEECRDEWQIWQREKRKKLMRWKGGWDIILKCKGGEGGCPIVVFFKYTKVVLNILIHLLLDDGDCSQFCVGKHFLAPVPSFFRQFFYFSLAASCKQKFSPAGGWSFWAWTDLRSDWHDTEPRVIKDFAFRAAWRDVSHRNAGKVSGLSVRVKACSLFYSDHLSHSPEDVWRKPSWLDLWTFISIYSVCVFFWYWFIQVNFLFPIGLRTV